MCVSQQHRLLIAGWRAELLTGQHEVLVPAVHLVDGNGVRLCRAEGPVTYLHLMFDRHEVITADGLLTESFYPGAQSVGVLDENTRDELFALFPELARGQRWSGARTGLRAWESAVLAA